MKGKITSYFIRLFGLNFQDILWENQRLTIRKLLKRPNVIIESPDSLGVDINIVIKENFAKLNIYRGTEFRNFCSIYLHEHASLTINSNVFFNNYCSINCLGNIEIGTNTIFGENVKLYDHNHHHQFGENGQLEVKRLDFRIGSIKIGENCWIGSNVTILNNVEIGDNVIIGANCLIYKSVPSNTIVKLKSEYVMEVNEKG
ncbi:MAG TPA: acyltransferase [Puia sp.]|nr:acyltransferase [Puia sp.]